MSISKRDTPNGVRYDVRWLDGTKHRSRTFRRSADAKAFEAELVRRRVLGSFAPVEPSSQFVADACQAWVDHGKTVWSTTTVAKRESQLRIWIRPMLDGVRLRELTRVRVKHMRNDMKAKGASNKMVNEVVKTLSAFLSSSAEDGLIPSNPISRMPSLRVLPTERRPPTDDEIAAVLDHLSDPRDRAVILLLAGTGMRPGELCGLRNRDVSDDGFHVMRSVQKGDVIPPKNNKSRWTPMTDEARRGLALAPAGGPDDYVITATSIPLNWINWLGRAWGPTRKALDVKWVPYDLRHRRASIWIAEGVPPPKVAAYLGHTLAVLWERYAHVI